MARNNDADICPLNHNKIKGTLNIASLIISTFLVLIMAGIVVLAVFLNFLNKGIDFGYFDSIILYLYGIFKLSFYS